MRPSWRAPGDPCLYDKQVVVQRPGFSGGNGGSNGEWSWTWAAQTQYMVTICSMHGRITSAQPFALRQVVRASAIGHEASKNLGSGNLGYATSPLDCAVCKLGLLVKTQFLHVPILDINDILPLFPLWGGWPRLCDNLCRRKIARSVSWH